MRDFVYYLATLCARDETAFLVKTKRTAHGTSVLFYYKTDRRRTKNQFVLQAGLPFNSPTTGRRNVARRWGSTATASNTRSICWPLETATRSTENAPHLWFGSSLPSKIHQIIIISHAVVSGTSAAVGSGGSK
jgi:hypothetical protein